MTVSGRYLDLSENIKLGDPSKDPVAEIRIKSPSGSMTLPLSPRFGVVVVREDKESDEELRTRIRALSTEKRMDTNKTDSKEPDSRRKQIKRVLKAIKDGLCERFDLDPSEVSLKSSYDIDSGDVELTLTLSGVGQTIDESELRSSMQFYEAVYRDVLTGDGWLAKMSQTQLSELPTETLAIIMRKRRRQRVPQ